jgi:hypothetical protein
LSSSFEVEEKKKKHKEQKIQREDRAYLSSLTCIFGMKRSFFSPHSFNVELSTFLKSCVSHLLKTSPQNSVLLKLGSSPELWRWSVEIE